MGQHRGIAFGLVVTICLVGFVFLANREYIPAKNSQVKIFNPIPRAAGGWNYEIYLVSLSSFNVPLKGSITIQGYVRKWNGVSWVYATNDNNISMYADMVAAGTGSTNNFANFTMTLNPVNTSWSVSQTHSLIVNVTAGLGNVGQVYNAYNPNPYYNPTLQLFTVYTDSQINPSPTPLSQWYLPGDSITVSGNLTSHTVPSLLITGQTVQVYAGPVIRSGVTDASGSFTIPYELDEFATTMTYNFPGVSSYTGSSTSLPLHMLSPGDVVLTSLKLPGQVFEGQSFIISGKLVLNTNPSIAMANRQITVLIQNATSQVLTDAQGNFNTTFAVPVGFGAGSWDVSVFLLYQNNGSVSDVGAVQPGALTVGSQFSPTNPENTGSYVLIGTIIGVVAAIIVIFLLIRKGFIKITRARPLYETNPVTLMGRVNALATTGRMAEAMAYLLYKYLDSLRFTMQMKKKPGQTVREVATEAVRRKLHQAEILYPWTSFVESAIYSGRRVSQSDLIKSKEYFEVANSVFPFAEHAPVPPAATGLPAEVPISVDQVPPEPSGEDNNAENA